MYSTKLSLNITWSILASIPQWIFSLKSHADSHYGAPPEALKTAYSGWRTTGSLLPSLAKWQMALDHLVHQPVLLLYCARLDLPVPEVAIISNGHLSICGPIFHLPIMQICFFWVALEDFPMLVHDILILGALDYFNSVAAIWKLMVWIDCRLYSARR